MHASSDAEDAKDNCVATIVRLIEKHREAFSDAEYNTYFEQIMTAIPFEGDVDENETII